MRESGFSHLAMLFMVFLGVSCTQKQRSFDIQTTKNYVLSVNGDTLPTGIPRTIHPQVVAVADLEKPKTISVGSPVVNKKSRRKRKLSKPISHEIDGTVLVPKAIEWNHWTATFTMAKSQNSVSQRALPMRYKDAASVNIKYLDVEQGLSSSYVYEVIQDSRGNLWFATQDGAVIYDGTSFTRLGAQEGLQHPAIATVIQDNEGNIWFGAQDGALTKYDGVNLYHLSAANGIPGNVNTIFQDRRGKYWIGTTQGIVLLKHLKQHEVTLSLLKGNGVDLSGSYQSFEEGADGSIWAGSENGLLKVFPGEADEPKAMIKYSSNEGFIPGPISALKMDCRGSLWFASSRDGGLGVFTDPDSGKVIRHYGVSQGLLGNDILSLYEDLDHNLWIGYDEFGLTQIKMDSSSEQFELTHYKEQNGLNNNIISSIREDDSGNVWLATIGGGVSCIGQQQFFHYTTDSGLPNNVVLSITEDKDGSLWFGTSGGGVSRYQYSKGVETFTTYNKNAGLIDNNVRSLLEDRNGRLWMGTDLGLSIFDRVNGTITNYTEAHGLTGKVVRDIIEDPQGNIWLATEGGVTKFVLYDQSNTLLEPAERKLVHYKERELSDLSLRSILQDSDGDIWIGSNLGVNRLDITKDLETVIFYTKNEGLVSNHIRTIQEDSKGNIWFGSHGGVSFFNKKGGQRKFYNYTTNEGISNNTVWAIIEDQYQNIWLGTERGISELYPTRNEPYGIITFGRQDGLKGMDFYPNCVLMDSQKNIWWGTGKSLTRQKISEENGTKTPPRPQLKTISIERNFVDYSRIDDPDYVSSIGVPNQITDSFEEIVPFYNYPKYLELPFTLRNVGFEFSAIDWASPEKIKYDFMLEGIDGSWNGPTSQNSVNYRLTEGDYVFKLRARGNSGEISEAVTYPFVIHPPWWRSFWGRFTFSCLAAVSIFGFVRWRTAYLEKARKKLTDTVSERTVELKKKNEELEKANEELREFTYIVSHDLKSPLRGIKMLSEWIREDKENILDKESNRNLDLLVQKVSNMGDFIDAILTYYRVGADSKNKEVTSLDDVYEKTLSLLSVPETIVIEKDTPLPTIYASEIHFIQVFQNLISNAIKYMDKASGAIQIGMKKGSKLVFYVKDNGPGIDEKHHMRIFKIFETLEKKDDSLSTGIGLSIVKKIVKLYEGDIWLESQPGNGSTFYFSIAEKYLMDH